MGIRFPLSSTAAAALRGAAVIIAAGAGVAWGAESATPGAAPVAVPTVAVRSAAAGGGFELDGSLQPVRQSTVAAQVGGNVLVLAVKAGDRVKAGQLLARVDARETQAGVQRGDAAVAQANAQLANARMHAQRTRDLRAQGFISQAALDEAETQLRAAQAGVQEAQAGRTQAALARGFADVTAPFDAVVLATHVEAGDLATPGRALVTLYAPGQLRAVVQLPSSRANQAALAQKVEVQLPTGAWVAPERRTELPAADAVSQTVEWRLDLPAAAAAQARPGQTVRVRFVAPSATAAAGAPQRLTVPANAIVRRGELTGVYVVQGGRFVLRAVRTGAVQGDQVEVLAGLSGSEQIAGDAVRAGLAGATPARSTTASAQ
jgi:RND family efflux transporter MFP subunit